MTCHNCRIDAAKAGKRADGMQRNRCGKCGKTFSEHKTFGLLGVKQSADEASAMLALRLIVKGNSVRRAKRISGLDKKTILGLIVWAGQRCESLLASMVRNVPVRDVQGDEIWGYVAEKESRKRPHEENDETIGDAWCVLGIERQTRLVLAFELRKRNEQAADRFMEKLVAATFYEPFQLSTDGFACYRIAVYSAFGERVDYAQSIKTYAQAEEPQRRYGPAKIVTVENKSIYGNPKEERILHVTYRTPERLAS